MELIINNEKKHFKERIRLEKVASELGIKSAVCATVDGRLRELTYVIDNDAKVEFLGLDTHDGMRIYEATLRYIFAYAIYRINPSLKVRFSYSVSRSILATIENGMLSPEMMEEIANEVRKIVAKKLPIRRLSVSKDEATQIYTTYGYKDKIETLKFRQEDMVNVYQCGEYVNYMFSYMLPNTSYLNQFDVKFYSPG